jgi:hypothetical protein
MSNILAGCARQQLFIPQGRFVHSLSTDLDERAVLKELGRDETEWPETVVCYVYSVHLLRGGGIP